MLTLSDIINARNRLGNAIQHTPCPYSYTLSELTGCHTYHKLESFQMTGSFKERGALNRLLSLNKEEQQQGVVTASAGNHAFAIAYHSRRLSIPATIVMPVGTPLIKVSSVRREQARVILHGENYDEAYAYAQEIARQENRIFIHAFDDPLVIAGQGTIGLELLEEPIPLDAVVVPVGGGGLISGIAIAIKETNPKIKIFGVEANNAPSMTIAIEKNQVTEIPISSTIADGIAVKKVGINTFPLVKRYVDDMVTVTDEEIANAILLLLEIEKIVAEGAGATPLAALVNRKIANLEGKKVVCILSGGNIDVNLLSRIIEKGLVKDGRLAKLRVRLPDRPGFLGKLGTLIGSCNANILEISHNRQFPSAPLGENEVDFILETRGQAHIEEIITLLRKNQYQVENLSQYTSPKN
ncbi:MAG: threonine ammonia-lyase [bacterium]|nr:threonine ammonia-lyase [bacterium]